MNNLWYYLKKLGKREQGKPKVSSRKKEIVTKRAEINE